MNQPTNEQRLRIDVGFAAGGGPLPLDHGYPLFASLCRALGNLHGARWLSVHPLLGTPLGDGLMALRQNPATLRLRVDHDRLPTVLALAGKTLEVAGAQIPLGSSRIFLLQPSAAIFSRQVSIRGYQEEAPFVERVKRELANRGLEAELVLGRRRVITVSGKKVVGFGLTLRKLDERASLALQTEGLGGRQRFGCGVFSPLTEA